MPTYEYMCDDCDLGFEVIKSIKEYATTEACTACGKAARRVFTCQIHFTGTKIEDAEFNPGLGQITKSKRHREDLAKRMGVEEIGNQDPDRTHDHFEKTREENRKKAWDAV
jgi:putative FmdB family regulatory protein